MSNPAEIERRFVHHPPTPAANLLHDVVNRELLRIAHVLDEMLPDGREKALALTELQSTRMWAHAAIATAP